jgi:hypothetical protein
LGLQEAVVFFLPLGSVGAVGVLLARSASSPSRSASSSSPGLLPLRGAWSFLQR